MVIGERSAVTAPVTTREHERMARYSPDTAQARHFGADISAGRRSWMIGHTIMCLIVQDLDVGPPPTAAASPVTSEIRH
jgi:hypothetical protein